MTKILTHNGRIKITQRNGLSDLHSLLFDGTASSYAQTPGNVTLGSELSLECFIKANVLSGADFVAGFGTSGSADRFYFTTVNGTNKIQVNLRSTATATLYGITSTTTLIVGTVYHVCATYSDTEGKLRLYINGVQEGGDLAVVVGSVGVRQLFIGGVSTGIFEGFIDNVRLYRRKLSSAEVLAHSTGTFNDNTSLALEWKFDAGFGTGIGDTSGNNTHGTIPSTTAVLWSTRLVDF